MKVLLFTKKYLSVNLAINQEIFIKSPIYFIANNSIVILLLELSQPIK